MLKLDRTKEFCQLIHQTKKKEEKLFFKKEYV